MATTFGTSGNDSWIVVKAGTFTAVKFHELTNLLDTMNILHTIPGDSAPDDQDVAFGAISVFRRQIPAPVELIME